MKKVFSKLPIPGRNNVARKLEQNNRRDADNSFKDGMLESDPDTDSDAGGEADPLTSANLRAHKGGSPDDRVDTSEGQRVQRGIENASQWVGGKARPNGSEGSSDSEGARRPSGFGLPGGGGKRGSYSGDGSEAESSGMNSPSIPLGQKMFDEVRRAGAVPVSADSGTKGGGRRGSDGVAERAGKVRYNLSDDSESGGGSSENEMPGRSGLLAGITRTGGEMMSEIDRTLGHYGKKTTVSRGGARPAPSVPQSAGGGTSRFSEQTWSDAPPITPQWAPGTAGGLGGGRGVASTRVAAVVRDDISDSDSDMDMQSPKQSDIRVRSRSAESDLPGAGSANWRVTTASSYQSQTRGSTAAGQARSAVTPTATNTLARTIHAIEPQGRKNPELMNDIDSDSDVLGSDSESDGEKDTFRRVELAHKKTPAFSIDGVNDFDQFMKSVDKSVTKAVKIEKRYNKAKSRNGRPKTGSREPSPEEDPSISPERPPPPEVKAVVTRSGPEPNLNGGGLPRAPGTAGGGRGAAEGKLAFNGDGAGPSPSNKATVAKQLGGSVGLRRQQLGALEGRGAMSRPGTRGAEVGGGGSTRAGTSMSVAEQNRLAAQMEEMEMLRKEQQDTLQREREQEEILNRLRRDKQRRESKAKEKTEELEKLWEEQMKKDSERFNQDKEIERLRAELRMKEERELNQKQELERLRRDVAERARADAAGAAAFDQLLMERHKKLLMTPDEIRAQVDNEVRERQRAGASGGAASQAEAAEEGRRAMSRGGIGGGGLAPVRRESSGGAGEGRSDVSREGSGERQLGREGSGGQRRSESRSGARAETPSGPRDEGGREGRRVGTGGQGVSLAKVRAGSLPGYSAGVRASQSRGGRRDSQVAAEGEEEEAAGAGFYNRGGEGSDSRMADDGSAEGAAPPAARAAAVASKEAPVATKARQEVVTKLKLDQLKKKYDVSPALKSFEAQREAEDHRKELQRTVQDAKDKVELAEAQAKLEEASEKGSSQASALQRAESQQKLEELRRLEEERAEFERREKIQEEYLQQLRYEQENKIESAQDRRHAVREMRGENKILEDLLKQQEAADSKVIREASSLEDLKEQFKRKEELAQKLKDQREELVSKQRARETELNNLKSEVSKSSAAEGIQLMQMERLKNIQEESRRMQERQQQELEKLRAEVQRRVAETDQAKEIEAVKEQQRKLEEEQRKAREELDKERAGLERAMQEQKALEAERRRIQEEKERREQSERELREAQAAEERELQRLKVEAEAARKEMERLQRERDEAAKEVQGNSEKAELEREIARMRAEKEAMLAEEEHLRREREELASVNRKRAEDLKELERLRAEASKLEQAEAEAKRKELEAMRLREEQERIRIQMEEDKLRMALEFEAARAKMEMEEEKRKRQAEIDRLKREIDQRRIQEEDMDEELEDKAKLTRQNSKQRRISDWVTDTIDEETPEAAQEAANRGDVTERQAGEDEDEGGLTNRSDYTDGNTTSRGPPTVWRLARHGKIKDLEGQLTSNNVDQRDPKGNTCLHHACMQNKKRVAKMLLRLRADINAVNDKGNTCLHYCFGYNYSELGEYLITKGADPNIKNKIGATCREVMKGVPGHVTAR